MISLRALEVSAYKVPTDYPESDGTLDWEATTMILVEVHAGNKTGIGYTYAHEACAVLIEDLLKKVILNSDAMEVTHNWSKMIHAIRNLGQPGLVSCAIAAVDTALWDLKAKLLGLPLVTLLGAQREGIEIYGSGGFTSYPPSKMESQLSEWKEQGLKKMKIKIGTHPDQDLERVIQAKKVIGPDAELFVDANGAFSCKEALAFAESFADKAQVTWFEEPVASDHLEELNLLKMRAPAGMNIAAGEYGYDITYFKRMLDSSAVDVLQADATRCGGFGGFMQVAALCDAYKIPLSAHTAPALHLHACCALAPLCHLEYFHDHVRIENIFFEGVAQPQNGKLSPNLSRPGMGLVLKKKDVEKFAI